MNTTKEMANWRLQFLYRPQTRYTLLANNPSRMKQNESIKRRLQIVQRKIIELAPYVMQGGVNI